MSWWPPSLLFDATHVEFQSRFSLSDSIERLRTGTYPWYSFGGLFQERAIGAVTAERVTLERLRPFFRNDFKPRFVGHFVEAGGRVLLVGRFSMRTWTKVFMSVWLGFCLLWTAGATIAAIAQPTTPGYLPVFGLGMCAFGSLLVVAGKAWARSDESWLSDFIRSRLGGAT